MVKFKTAGIPIRWPALIEARKAPTLGLLNTDGKGKGILAPVWGKRIVRGIINRNSRLRPTMIAVPVQLHLTVSGTVAWAVAAASNIKSVKVLSPK